MQWYQVVPIAALVSTFVTLLLRWFDRPRAVLRLEGRLSQRFGDGLSSGAGEGPTEMGRTALMNVGDGDAYDVKVFGSKCDPAIFIEQANWGYSVPVVRAGDEAILVVGANADESKREGAALIVTWSHRPRRWFRKRLRVELAELGLADLLPPGLLPVGEIPARTRRTRSLEELSPRAQLYRRSDGVVHPLSPPEP